MKEPYKRWLSALRDKWTLPSVWVSLLEYCGEASVTEILKHEPTVSKQITTGNEGKYQAAEVGNDEKYVGIAVLRAGHSLMDGVYSGLRKHGITSFYRGWAGIKRVEDEEAWEHQFDFDYDFVYPRMPEKGRVDNRAFILADVMNASAGTWLAILDELFGRGIPKRVYFVNVVSAKFGHWQLMNHLRGTKFGKTEFFVITGEVDDGGVKRSGLDEKGYITPGLGDAGDRSSEDDDDYIRDHLGMTSEEYYSKRHSLVSTHF